MATAIQTKERPILFSGPMVQAILDGRKTQTRRIFKPQPVRSSISDDHWEFDGQVYICDELMHDHLFHNVYGVKGSPYGSVWGDGSGDRLWVRESFYDRADYADIGKLHTNRFVYVADGVKSGWKAHPSIHMPRKASRITLQLTNVRIERLQAITEEGAIAEGVGPGFIPCWDRELSIQRTRCVGYVPMFRKLWNQINGDDAWDRNDWVWVIEFKKL